MPAMRLLVTVFALTVLVWSCARNRADLRGAVVRVDPDSVPFERTPDVTRITINVIIRNDRPTTLYYGGCVPQVEQEINGQWRTVWQPICVDLMMGAIAPGDSSMYPVTVARFPHLRVEPQLDPIATPGRYRLQLGAVYSGALNLHTRYSGKAPPEPKVLGELTSPVFTVYQP